jgi:hypothetical protein
VSDFLLNLARASVEPGATLRPRLASRFEPLVPLDTVGGQSVEARTGTHPQRTTRPQPEAAPIGGRRPPHQRAVGVATAAATPAIESASAPSPDHRDPTGPAPAPETSGSPPEALDRRAPIRPPVLRARQEVRGLLSETKAPISASREAAEGWPLAVPFLRSVQPLAPPRPEAALVPPAPIRPVPSLPVSHASGTSTEPTVHVTIGRIEIRAVPPERREQTPSPDKPTGIMSLDDYVERRSRVQR